MTRYWLQDVLAFVVLFPLTCCVVVLERFNLVSLYYDANANVRVIVLGRMVKHWPGEDFGGWGHPFSPLFRTHGEWMKRSKATVAPSPQEPTEARR